MKIAFVTDIYFPSVGGVEVETGRMAQAMANEGHEVWIIAPTSKKGGVKNKEGLVNIIGIESYLTPFHKSLRFVPFALAKKKVSKILGEINPDVIHIQSFLYLAKAAGLYAKKFNIATVATGHYAEGDYESYFKDLKPVAGVVGFLIKSFHKSALKNVDMLTVPSETSRKYFSKILKDKKRISVISNGIDLQKFSGKSGTESGKKTVLFVGRLEPVKNVETVIRAMAIIAGKTDARLILVGGGSSETVLKNLAAELGMGSRVRFLGYTSQRDVRREYKKASVFVTASLAENQPLTILEAAASGLPIAASNAGGIPELVREGRNGYLFNPRDSGALAQSVLKILSDKKLASRMGRESLKIAGEHDFRGVVYEMESLYQKVVAQAAVKRMHPGPAPSFVSRGFAVKLAFAVLLLAILFRSSLASPATAKASGIKIRNGIANSKVVKNIKNLDLKLKTTLSKHHSG